MVGHWDDVRWSALAHGELRCERQRLVPARDGAGATLSRYRIAAGRRSMPLHVHVDEEELFYVLAGSGYSWQGDARHEIAAGDMLVHLADGAPHTLMAGDEPLEVLAYASGSPTSLTLLPRSGLAWIGSRWFPQDAPHPFAAEPPAGELPPVAPRPTTIVALDDVEPALQDRGPVHRTRRDLGRRAGSRLSGLQHVTVIPGRRSSVCHATRARTRSSSSSRVAATCCSATSATPCGRARSSCGRLAPVSPTPSRQATTVSSCSPTALASRPTCAGIPTRRRSPSAAWA